MPCSTLARRASARSVLISHRVATGVLRTILSRCQVFATTPARAAHREALRAQHLLPVSIVAATLARLSTATSPGGVRQPR